MLASDLRYGFRALARQPRFTVLVAVMLALAIGASTAVFSIVDAVVLEPLPYAGSDRLVWLWSVRADNPIKQRVSYPDLRDWQAQSRTLDLVGYGGLETVLTGRGDPERLRAEMFLGDLVSMLGVRPILGGVDTADRDVPQVILSHRLWRRRFDSDPKAVGKVVTLDGMPYVVAAVMPAGFQFPLRAAALVDVWMPLHRFNPALANRRGARLIEVIGRMRPGVSVEQAQAEMNVIAAGLGSRYPDTNKDVGVRLTPAVEEVTGDVSRSLLLLGAAVGALLLIGCANVAALSLARATEREEEMAVRTALGAGSGRIARQLVSESMLLGLLGGALGCLLAYWAVGALRGLFEETLPRASEIAVNGTVLVFAAAVSLGTGVLFGAAPAWAAARTDVAGALRRGARSASRAWSGTRLSGVLVVGEIALATLLLTAAGLLAHSYLKLDAPVSAFDSKNVLTFEVSWPSGKYPEPGKTFALLQARLLAHPGILAASTGLQLPDRGQATLDDTSPFVRVEGSVVSAEARQRVSKLAVQPGYFRALGIPLLEGRDFDDEDRSGAPRAVIVNEALARAYLAGADPLGKRLSLDSWVLQGEGGAEIVGVAADVKHRGLRGEAEPMVYLPFAQSPAWTAVMVVKTRGEPLALVPAVRDAVRSIDPDEPIDDVRTLEQRIAGNLSADRWRALLLGVFAVLAVGIAGAGLFSVLSYVTAQRTREIGIRIALGATAAEVVMAVVARGMKLTAIGVLIGLAASAALHGSIDRLLFGVEGADPYTLFGVVVVLVAAALPACVVPARRAARAGLLEVLNRQ